MAIHQVNLTYSMNGFRRNLSETLNQLKEKVVEIKNDGYLPSNHIDDLIEVVDDLLCQSNAVNCVYMQDLDDFSDMSDVYVPLICEEPDDEQ